MTGFREKPRAEQWVNGGFLVLEPGALDVPVARTRCSSASRSSGWPPTAALAAYRHEGYWRCLDTYKDAVALEEEWVSGSAPGSAY